MSPTPPHHTPLRSSVGGSEPAPPPREMEKLSAISLSSFLGDFMLSGLLIFQTLLGELGAGGRFFPGGHLAWSNGWAGTALSPPGQAEKRQELLSAPPSAGFRKRRPASERKLLIRSRSASHCHVTFPLPPERLHCESKTIGPFTQMQMSPGRSW